MNKYFISNLIPLIFAFILFSATAVSQIEEKPNIGFEEKLGEYIPDDAQFLDEYGKPLNLKSSINKPTILSLVYYRCSGICTPTLNGIADMVKHIDLEPGTDFDLVTISFDPTDDYTSAKDKRDNYLDLTEKKLDEGTWKFLTGDSANIKKITDAVGFKYIKQDKDFAHASGVIIISPEGKIIRYLFGIMFLPLDVKLAVAEADEGITGPSINKVLKFCYSYDPEGRKYTFNLLKVVGSGMLLTLAFIFVVLIVKKNKPVDPHPRKEI